ncbi:polysaccharide deacetylase family protein [Aureibaculum conchae]|uniref:hypothetical protein n=1 Tax=Aureibaculum sp. 2308TA14-22 TaxID=3108392 RepID=UPI00339274DE
MDFTFKKYKELVQALKDQGYTFQTFEDFIKSPNKKVVVLRHDVDRRSPHSLDQGKDEIDVGAVGTYFFRIVPESNQPKVMKAIVDMGHELAYHYEDLGMARGNYEKAYESYKKNLDYFRKFYPVSTICMHGSPANSIDNRDIWKKYNYRDFDIIGEPYFDIDFDEVFYITDAGRRWNNTKVSVRDKVTTKYNFPLKTTDDIIKLVKNDTLPDKLMINTHPHNWSNFGLLWIWILSWQNFKNIIKAILIKVRGSKNIKVSDYKRTS